MTRARRTLIAVAIGLAGAQLPLSSSALVSWTFDSASCIATTGPGGSCGPGDGNFSDGRTYAGTGGAGNVTVTGWANTISSNTRLELGQITHFGGGLGVRNADAPAPAGRGGDDNEGNPPEHAVDNDQRFDLVLFDFGNQLVDLSQITLGYIDNDSDISVLAYTGSDDPTDGSGIDYIGDQEAWWLSSTENNETLTSSGWTLIGNHDVDDGPEAPSQTINAGDVASSYWLVSAFNPVFGSDCTPSNGYCQADYEEFFKILALAGEIVPPHDTPGVPEPATLSMLVLGLGGTGAAYRRRRRLETTA